jgi:hypothetical protein
MSDYDCFLGSLSFEVRSESSPSRRARISCYIHRIPETLPVATCQSSNRALGIFWKQFHHLTVINFNLSCSHHSYLCLTTSIPRVGTIFVFCKHQLLGLHQFQNQKPKFNWHVFFTSKISDGQRRKTGSSYPEGIRS